MRNLLKLVALFLSVISIYTFRDTNIFKVNQVHFKTKKLPFNEKLRIVQISDMHNKSAWGIHKRLVKEVDGLAPDIVVLTGDLIDRRTRDFRKIVSFTDMLTETNIPLFFVTGNHEWGNRKGMHLLKEFEKRNITILGNKAIKFKRADTKVTIVGIDDTSTEHENIAQAFQGVKDDAYAILLSHSPYAIKKYPNLPVDLVLSGHTHGGQVRFPIIGAVISPGGGMFPELDKGVFQWRKDKYIYVDSGLGTSMIPVRFLNQCQISLIEIEGDN